MNSVQDKKIKKMQTLKDDNILAKPFDEAPFDQIKTADYKPAIEAAIQDAREEIDFIASAARAPNF